MNDKPFEHLLAQYMESALTAEERRDFMALLKEHEEYRKRLIESVDFASELDLALGQKLRALDDSVFRQIDATTLGQPAPMSSCRNESPRKSRRLFWVPLAAAGAAAIAAGWLMVHGSWLMSSEGAIIARVVELRGEVTANHANFANKKMVKVGDEIRAGDQITVGKGGRVRLAYVSDETSVELGSNAECRMSKRSGDPDGSGPNAELLELRKGRLTAHVAKREGRFEQKGTKEERKWAPFVVETPHAVVLVKGTRFKVFVDKTSSRLEVSEGVVGFTSLADGESVDVAAGRMASVGTDIPLTVKAIAAPAFPPPIGYTLGPIIFEDNFDKGLNNWELLVGKDVHHLEPAGEETADILELRNAVVNRLTKGWADVLDGPPHSCVRMPRRGEMARGRLVCLRGRAPITEEAFSVKYFIFDARVYGSFDLAFPWAETIEERVHMNKFGKVPSDHMMRLDYTPAGQGEDGVPLLEVRRYVWSPRRILFREERHIDTSIIACRDRRLGIAFNGGHLRILRVEVRRLEKKQESTRISNPPAATVSQTLRASVQGEEERREMSK